MNEFRDFLNKNICRYLQIETADKVLPENADLDFTYQAPKLVSKIISKSIKIIPRTQQDADMNNFLRFHIYKEENVKYIVEKQDGAYIIKAEIINMVENSLQLPIEPMEAGGIIYAELKAQRTNIQG